MCCRISLVALLLVASTAQAHYSGHGGRNDMPRLHASIAGRSASLKDVAPRAAYPGIGRSAGQSPLPTAGHSTLRENHVQSLKHCNPFANVRSDRPLTTCN